MYPSTRRTQSIIFKLKLVHLSKWEGPYIIIKVFPCVVEVFDEATGNTFKVDGQ